MVFASWKWLCVYKSAQNAWYGSFSNTKTTRVAEQGPIGIYLRATRSKKTWTLKSEFRGANPRTLRLVVGEPNPINFRPGGEGRKSPKIKPQIHHCSGSATEGAPLWFVKIVTGFISTPPPLIASCSTPFFWTETLDNRPKSLLFTKVTLCDISRFGETLLRRKMYHSTG